MRDIGLYNERNPQLPLDSINHNINQFSYYMFGYQARVDGTERFMFSPLGNLFLKYADNKEYAPKIFVTMLWGIQYSHPHSGTDKVFQLYPFRLIYKLLKDQRLEGKLYAFEIAYAVVFVKEATMKTYEKLVTTMLELRQLANSRLTELFQADPHVYVNAAYEWDYYVSKLLESAGVLKKTEGEIICHLRHGKILSER